MATISDLSKGNFVRYNGEVMQIEELLHRTPGNLRAFYQVKMRNLRNGKVAENRFRPGDEIEILRVETKEYQYLYQDGESLVCMDNQTFDQVYIDQTLLGESGNYVKECLTLLLAFESGTIAITAEGPSHVVLEVLFTQPVVECVTATRTLKPATMENGVEIRVPLFINTGEKIKV